MKGQESKMYEEQLRSPGLFSFEKRKLREDPITVYSFLTRRSAREDADVISLMSNRTQENIMKLQQGKFRLEIRKKFYTKRVVEHWNRLPRSLFGHFTEPERTQEVFGQHYQTYGLIFG